MKAAYLVTLDDDGNVAKIIDADPLLGDLASLGYYGYQPMYNGRPSCPFCGNFVDSEETHEPECTLVTITKEVFE